MRTNFYTFPIFLCSFLIINTLFAQRTLYSTGQGGDTNWLTPENWSEDSAGATFIATPPTPDDHLIIRHDIFKKVLANYTHFGNITITREGHLTIFSGGGNSDPYIFAGDTCLIQGRLTSSSDFHHQIFGSDGDGVLIFDTFAVVEVGDDLILNAFGQTLMNNPNCGAGGSFDDLYFKGTNSTLCGTGRFVIPDAIRAWDDDDNEIIPSSLQTVDQICPEFSIYETLEECLEDEILFPVEFINFEAKTYESSVQILWETAWETNNLFFTLERSSDAKSFETVIDIPGALNSTEITSYEFTDHQPINGRSYYRLMQTDIDGKTSYSSVVEVNFQIAEAQLSVYPNPMRSNEILQIKAGIDKQSISSPVGVQILDLAGKIVFEDRIVADETGYLSTHLVPRLSNGIYLVKIQTGRRALTEKLIVN